MEQEANRNYGKDGEKDEEKWVHDSSVDYKGRVPLRDSTGVWKASLFIISKWLNFKQFPDHAFDM